MNNEKPVFIQIIEMIEDDILSGVYHTDDLIISTPQISKLLSVNPTTAQRAVSVLSDRGIVSKKRGIGMAVTEEAKEMILAKRKNEFYEQVIPDFLSSAEKIGISHEELVQIVKENYYD